MQNWKTFVFGLMLAFGVAVKPLQEKRGPNTTEILEIAGAFGLGTASKDKDVTGVGTSARRIKEK